MKDRGGGGGGRTELSVSGNHYYAPRLFFPHTSKIMYERPGGGGGRTTELSGNHYGIQQTFLSTYKLQIMPEIKCTTLFI